MPTGAGESYDASTRLMQTLVARVHDDLAATNAHRAALQLPLYPPMTTAWTMRAWRAPLAVFVVECLLILMGTRA